MSTPQVPVLRSRRQLRLPVIRRQGWQAVAFLLPAVGLLTVFLIYPMFWTIALSFDRGRGLTFTEFVGFDNYVRLFTADRRFLDLSRFPPSGAVVNNILWFVVYTSLCVALGLLTAVLAAKVRYEAVLKAIIFVPMAISAVAVGIIWLFVYNPNPQIGLLNAIMTAVRPDTAPVAWTGRPSTVNFAIIIANVWASTGFAMVVLSAALKGIEREIIEAARTDGASEWDLFRHIQLPMIKLPLTVVIVWLLVNVIKVFDIIYIMTRGGPGGASRVIAYTMFIEAFDGGRGGYASAVAVFMLLLIIPIIVLNIRRFRSEAVIR